MSERPNVKAIALAYLKEHGYSGLYEPDDECGCADSDLMPCDASCDRCLPGYRGPDPTCEGNFGIYAEPPSEEEQDERGD